MDLDQILLLRADLRSAAIASALYQLGEKYRINTFF